MKIQQNSSKDVAKDSQERSPKLASRRNIIRAAGITGTVFAVNQWHSPVIKSILLPAHAATSPDSPVDPGGSSSTSSTSSTSSSSGGSSGGGSGAITVNTAASATAGVSGSVTGATAGEDITFDVMFFDDLGNPKGNSFSVVQVANSNGDSSFSRSVAQLLADHGVTLDPGCTVVIQVTTEAGVTANDSDQIPAAPPSAFSVKDSGPLPDGGVSLSGCGATPSTQVTFTVTVKDVNGVPLATGTQIPVLVENNGCATFDYTYADLNGDLGGDPPNGYYVCIDGQDATLATDSTDVYAP